MVIGWAGRGAAGKVANWGTGPARRGRSRVRLVGRFAFAGALLVALVALSAGYLPGGLVSAAPTLELSATNGRLVATDSGKAFVVMGEVRNTGNTNAQAELVVTGFDGGGATVATARGRTAVEVVPAGGSAPFAVALVPSGDATVARYTVDVTGIDATRVPASGIRRTGADRLVATVDGQRFLVGEIYNGSISMVGPVRIAVAFAGRDGKLVHVETTHTLQSLLQPGQAWPFKVAAPADAATWQIVVEAFPTGGHRPNLSLGATTTSRDVYDRFHVVGTVRNNTQVSAGKVVVVATFRDSGGRVVNMAAREVAGDTILPGQEAGFDLDVPTMPSFESYELQVTTPTILPFPPGVSGLFLPFIAKPGESGGGGSTPQPTPVSTPSPTPAPQPTPVPMPTFPIPFSAGPTGSQR
ncbi:MAG: hypothetical protein HY329_07955 [Chloroflexi bacterium]|nr:hypothetical protein [Chloroflexota bacterium]